MTRFGPTALASITLPFLLFMTPDGSTNDKHAILNSEQTEWVYVTT